MARPEARIGFVQFVLGVGVLAVVARAAQLQLVEGGRWARRAAHTRTVTATLPARRGTIYDRAGLALAITQAAYHVNVAPEQVKDPDATARRLAAALGEKAAEVERGLRSGRPSLYFYGPYTALQVQPLRGIRGIYFEPFFRRTYPLGDLARPVVGALAPDSSDGASGIELALDSVLAGAAGAAVQLRDPAGRRYESPGRLLREPVAGDDVLLTLDARLQEIAERALDQALEQMQAASGGVLFLDPRSGEVLAVASRLASDQSTSAAFASPFEPGSTAKLFTAAALLADSLVRPADAVGGEDGKWTVEVPGHSSYTITDAHAESEPLTLARAIEVSSNIAMAKFSRRLTPAQQYAMLRDFGFGSLTGVEFPAESRGALPRPEDFRPYYTRESLSRGYGFSVTALQLALAYAAIANGGILYTPTLVREIRAPDGEVLYRHRPEPVRRVVPAAIAAQLRDFLRGAVSAGGTGGQAQIRNFALVGKTGTARRAGPRGYIAGSYVASFAAIWPADRPQLVSVVTIIDPKGGYYAAETAAPLTRQILEAALASETRALDYDALAGRDSAAWKPAPESEPAAPTATVAVRWPLPPAESLKGTAKVPAVAGLSLRAAAATLFRAGFRVAVSGSGQTAGTDPAASTSLRRGALVTILTAP